MKYAILLALIVSGCATDDLTSEITSASTVENGQNLNGQNLNGPDNGTFTIWTSLAGVKRDGSVMDSTTLSKTMLTMRKGSSVYTGTDVVNAELSAMRGDGRTVRLRIRGVTPPATGSTMWRYQVEYREDDLNWYPICKDVNGPRAAIALNGIWDHRQGVPGGGAHLVDATKFTFACEGIGAIGKCVGIGYEPWRMEAGVDLWNHHQACVRLLRGDYCGDGSAYTQNGNRVNLFDNLGIQDDTEDWFIEAEWDQAGARCFYPANRSRAGIPCYNNRVTVACGSPTNFATGALLMDETPTLGLTP